MILLPNKKKRTNSARLGLSLHKSRDPTRYLREIPIPRDDRKCPCLNIMGNEIHLLLVFPRTSLLGNLCLWFMHNFSESHPLIFMIYEFYLVVESRRSIILTAVKDFIRFTKRRKCSDKLAENLNVLGTVADPDICLSDISTKN